jgi:hypothetical protein
MKPEQLVKMVAGALVTLALVTLGGRTLAEFKQIPMLSFVVLAFAFGLALVTGIIFGAAAAWFANVYRSRLSFFARNLRKAADLEEAQVCATNYMKQEVDMIRRNSGTGGIQ